MQDKNYKQMWELLKTFLQVTAAVSGEIETNKESDSATQSKAQIIGHTTCAIMEMMEDLEENGIPAELAEVFDAMDAIAAAEDDEEDEEGTRDAC